MLLSLMTVAFAEPLVAVVVVDQEARERGYALEIDGWIVDDALPVDVADGEVLRLIDPNGRTEKLDLVPGEAWEVVGPDGEAWMSLLDDEIRTDLIAVKGPIVAIDALADSLDANIVIEDGQTYLSGRDILLDAGWVDDELALQVDEVAFVRVRVRDEAPVDARARQRAAIAATSPVVPSLPATPVAPTVVSEPVAAPVEQARPKRGKRAMRKNLEPPTRRPAQPLKEKLPPPGRVVGEAALEAFSGNYICRNEMLWLRPEGTWAFRGSVGSWRVVSPGVVRLESWDGDLWWRAAIGPDNRHCRDVWSPLGESWQPPRDENRRRRGR